MSEDTERFNDPKLAINKVYTKTGDSGKTSLVGGQRVAKNHMRIDTYGTVDELNAFVGRLAWSAEQELPDSDEKSWFLAVLLRVQHELFNLGSILATLPKDVHPQQPRIRKGDIEQLEADIDHVNGDLPPLRSFVLPGGSRTNTELHICRTVCRRLERLLVGTMGMEEVDQMAFQYINRLSDAFFVWSRWVNVLLGSDEITWQPNKAASGADEN